MWKDLKVLFFKYLVILLLVGFKVFFVLRNFLVVLEVYVKVIFCGRFLLFCLVFMFFLKFLIFRFEDFSFYEF